MLEQTDRTAGPTDPTSGTENEDSWDRLLRMLGYLAPAESRARLLWLLLLGSFLVRLLWLARPDGALIFDEKYYVNAARVLAGLPARDNVYGGSPLGLDPNTEHPPLAKLIVAGSIRLFGDNAYGWRIPCVVFGTLAILLLYRVGWRVSDDRTVGLLAAALLAFDNLVFVHSRVFTLDIFMLTFMLLGLDQYLRGRPLLGGAGFALGALCKLPGAFGIGALVVYELLRLTRTNRPAGSVRKAGGRLARLIVSASLIFLVLLGVMDRLWVGYSQPLEHLERIVSYGQVLRRQAPSGIESTPWQWLWNDVQIPYLRVEQQVKSGDDVRETRPLILFLGAMNPFVLALWPLGLALAGFIWWRRQPGGDLAALALAWFGAVYTPFVAASLFGQRISYLFYFLPVLPAVALAGSSFLLWPGLPRIVLWVYLGAVLLGFYGYFPFKPVP